MAAVSEDTAAAPLVLVLLRHGESEYNALNIFTGWLDPSLSAAGEAEARAAGEALAGAGYTFDICFTSVLRRSVTTAWAVLRALRCEWLPTVADWRLNERHYGALQGLNKAETAAAHGEAAVRQWRRSYDVRPPPLPEADARHPRHDRRYALCGAPAAALPSAESLADTVARFLPAWRGAIAPAVAAGRRVLIAAHGNSLRALIMHLERLTPEQIMERELPTGVPLVYELELRADGELAPRRSFFLGDAGDVAARAARVAAQGKAAAAAQEPGV